MSRPQPPSGSTPNRKRTSTPKKRTTTSSHWINPAVPVNLPESGPNTRPVSRARQRIADRKADQRLPKPDWTWAVIGVAVFGVIGVLALLLLTTTEPTPASAIAVNPDDATALPPLAGMATNAPQVSYPPIESYNIKAWDGQRRLTILLMGLDKRPGEVGRGFRTDTLILVSIDPATKKVGMLSIPRDIRVPMPNRPDLQPINAAYVLGELDRPGYGPRLTLETVQYNLGIPIDHYVVVSFDAVINLVNAIGGITVDVPTEIVDNEYPDMNTFGYDPLYIPAGRIEMNGELALKYARTRHQTSDFDRAQRQQQVILAVRQKILRPDVLPGVLAQAPHLWNTLSAGLITDLSFEQVLSIAWYLKDIDISGIRRGSVEGGYIQAVQMNGEAILTINRSTVPDLMKSVFGEGYNR